MKISFDCPDKVNGLMTITVEEEDYKADVEKTLKDYRKKANFPGFRPGMVPMGLIKRQFGSGVKMDVINKKLSESLQKYISDNNINMIGMPLGSDKQEPQDLEKEPPYTFMFDVAVAPEVNIELGDQDTVDYYDIKVDDEIINRQVEMYCARMGKYEAGETYAEDDSLKGDLRELDADGNTKADGVTVSEAVLMPKYFSDDDQKKLFEGCKAGDIITFNPRKVYKGDAQLAALLKVEKDQLAEHEGDFSFQVTEVSHFVNHAVDQELFDSVFGKDVVKSEEDFRKKIADELKLNFVANSDYKLLQDIRKYAEDKVGQLTYPEALIKRIMKQNNEKASQEDIDKNYEPAVKELNWSLIKSKLALQNGIKVDDNDVKAAAKEMARMQFAQYGMANVEDQYVDNYAEELLKKRENVDNFSERALDIKLTAALKDKVKLNHKEISLDDFNKMMEGAND